MRCPAAAFRAPRSGRRAMADRWTRRERASGWIVTLAGLEVNVAGNVGHVTGHALTSRAPRGRAAAGRRARGRSGRAQRVVAAISQDATAATETAQDGPTAPAVPHERRVGRAAGLRRVMGRGNALSRRQLADRFGLSRARAAKVPAAVAAKTNGRHPAGSAAAQPCEVRSKRALPQVRRLAGRPGALMYARFSVAEPPHLPGGSAAAAMPPSMGR